MKKIILAVAVLVVTFVSCSKDEETTQAPTPVATNDLIVGSWKQTAETIQNGATGTPTNHMTGQCDTSIIYEFQGNAGAKTGNSYLTDYNYVAPNCVVVPRAFNNIWTNDGNNIYRFVYGSGANNSIQVTLNFSNNNNTMLMTTNDANYIIKGTYSRQ